MLLNVAPIGLGVLSSGLRALDHGCGMRVSVWTKLLDVIFAYIGIILVYLGVILG